MLDQLTAIPIPRLAKPVLRMNISKTQDGRPGSVHHTAGYSGRGGSMFGKKVKYWINNDECLVGWIVKDHGDNIVDVSGWDTRPDQGPTFTVTSIPRRDSGMPGGHNWSPWS
jgi:hypothetical protein